MLRRPLTLATLLVVLAVAGCSPATVIPPASPTSAQAPLFASDDEALAAATEAYEEFLSVSSQILQDGGEDPERILPYLSDAVLGDELAGYQDFQTNEYRLDGESSVVNAELQQWFANPAGVEIVVYFCVSVEGTDVLDSTGKSVVSDDRPEESAFEVTFVGMPGSLLIDRKQVWPDTLICG